MPSPKLLEIMPAPDWTQTHLWRLQMTPTLTKTSDDGNCTWTCKTDKYYPYITYKGSAARLCLLHLARFVTSSGTRPTALMSSVTESIHRFLGLPRGRRSPGSRRSAVLATEYSSLHMVWPYHLRRASRIFSVIAATRSHRKTLSLSYEYLYVLFYL